jgi:catechol 2,3-dioxygenase-like lactoylglutathione lyase family enzyme
LNGFLNAVTVLHPVDTAAIGRFNVAVSLFSFSGGYVPVRDLDAAARWYAQTFGCKFAEIQDDEGQRNIRLYFDEEDIEAFQLAPLTYPSNDLPPIIFTGNAAKANEHLNRKNIIVYPVQRDDQGTKFFEIRDCDGNALEISEEP